MGMRMDFLTVTWLALRKAQQILMVGKMAHLRVIHWAVVTSLEQPRALLKGSE